MTSIVKAGAMDVGAHGVDHAVHRALQRVRLARRPGGQERLAPHVAPPDQEEAEDEDRDQREDRADDPRADVDERPGGLAERFGRVVRELVELAGDVEVVVERVGLAFLGEGVLQVGDVLGQAVDEADELAHDRRDEDRREDEWREDDRQVDDRDREAALHVPAQRGDRTGNADGDEGRQQAPAERLAHEVEEVQPEAAGHDRRDDPQRRARARPLVDDALHLAHERRQSRRRG
jgi:hypothetical protein